MKTSAEESDSERNIHSEDIHSADVYLKTLSTICFHDNVEKMLYLSNWMKTCTDGWKGVKPLNSTSQPGENLYMKISTEG